MKKIPDIINRLWNVCGQMEVGALLTCGSGIMIINVDGISLSQPWLYVHVTLITIALCWLLFNKQLRTINTSFLLCTAIFYFLFFCCIANYMWRRPLRDIDLLSKYLGTRVFDWPRGNFHLVRSPLYRERSGKLKVLQRQRLETGGKQLKTCPCRTVSVGGIRKNFFVPSPIVRRFFSSPPFPLAGSLCCGESLSKGRRDLASGFQPVSKFCGTRNRCGCDFFCDESWGFLPSSEVIAQRSEVFLLYSLSRSRANEHPSSHTQWLE